MPTFDAETQTKIAALRVIYDAGQGIEPFELVKVEWPSPDGTIYYSVLPTDSVANPAPPVSPIVTRIIPDNNPDWFLPVQLDATIGDEELDLEMWDADEVVSQLLVDHGEGVRTSLLYWFPQVELLLDVWHGHIEYGDEEDVEKIVLKAVQGFRSADATVPGRGRYPHCSAVFGGLLETQDEIDEHDCPFNFHIGGPIGNIDPATGLPWTFCDRRRHESCTDRGVNPLFHLSHRTLQTTILNTQSSGPHLLSTSQGNETNLKEPVRVVMGSRRLYDMKVMAFRRDVNTNTPARGWFYAMYEACEGPISAISQARIKVGNAEQNAVGMHYNYRLGLKGQSAISSLTAHGYSGTALILYNFGWVNPSEVGPGDASASAMITGLDNIRVYTNATTYTEIYTTNRVWHLARILCDKRWGYGLDYARLNIESFIEAADWCAQAVRYTDPFLTNWDHTRADSHVELIPKKIQQQIEDLCMAGRLSRPFLFDGKIHIVPLRKLTSGELAACPVFTDTGESRNIIWRDGKSTLRVGKRKSVRELVNRVECTFDDGANSYLQQPLRPIEDVDAQLAAGRLVGDFSRKINKKEYSLLGVVNEAQAIKVAWSLLDLGPHDEGGLQNNLPIIFEIWFADALDLHMEKVIRVNSSRLTKYGFTYFRVKKISRQSNLYYELECQAYNETYMATFETDISPVDPVYCTVDTDCGPGFVCVDGVCVAEPPPCRSGFGTISYANAALTIIIDPC